MATISFSTSSKQIKTATAADGDVTIFQLMVRFYHGRINKRAKTGVYVRDDYWQEHWNGQTQSFDIPKVRLMTPAKKRMVDELTELNNAISDIKARIQTAFTEAGKQQLDKDWLKNVLDNSTAEAIKPKEIVDYIESFLKQREFSTPRVKRYQVIGRMLRRFSLFNNMTLTFDDLTAKMLERFEDFIVNEYKYIDESMSSAATVKRYKEAFNQVPESREPKPRGKNTVCTLMSVLRTLVHWAIDKGLTSVNGFKEYKIPAELYGTPYYITNEERNHLYHTDMSFKPRLAVQRDIFVFQCLIGCRVGDLWAMTKDNIIDGAVEYIPRKTRDGRPLTVRVPLHPIAAEILERYKDCGRSLFPFTSQQKYNIAIKKMFRVAGLTRLVTVINPTTREEEKRPLCDIASSHLARRCFVGNIYKQVKDPNLVGKLSGHAEGSRAFSRYRDIDEQMKKDLITYLD